MFYQFNDIKEFKANNLLKTYPHDAGWDIRSGEEAYLFPKKSQKIKTGLHIIIPTGFYGMLKSRSGLGVNHGVEVTNAGIIDAGFLGELIIRVYNHSEKTYQINFGDRIAQILFGFSITVSVKSLTDTVIPTVFPELKAAEFFELSTDRGNNGYGSTGIK